MSGVRREGKGETEGSEWCEMSGRERESGVRWEGGREGETVGRDAKESGTSLSEG